MEKRMDSLEKRFDKIEESIQTISCDVRELVVAMKTTITPMIKKVDDFEQRLRAIELERARESTAREWLTRNWLSIAIMLMVFATDSAILSKLFIK